MSDDVALADDALQDQLCAPQDRIENMMRTRHGLPDRDAARELLSQFVGVLAPNAGRSSQAAA